MRKILVVEDELDVRRNLEDLLEAEGFKVLSAKDGLQGYEMATTLEPDIILSDIRMPNLDGFELLKRLQHSLVTSLIPFIFLTAKVDMQDMRHGMSIGADDYIIKPFKINDVIKAINSRLNKSDRYLSKIKEFKEVLMKRVPHELRTPLVSILGLSSIIQDDIEELSKDEILKMTERIHSSGKRLHRRIEKFLIYAELLNERKGESFNGFSYEIDEVILSNQLVKKSLEFGRKVDLQINFESAKVKIRPDYYEILLEELVENSLKFSKKGKPVVITGQITNQTYTTTVLDEGISIEGIKNSEINAFNQFNKTDLTEEGLGFGLAITRKIVDMAGGKINFIREDNSKNIVAIELPITV